MRVLFLTHNYPRTAGDVAGAFLHPLAVTLRELGVDVQVIAPSDRGQGGEAMLDGVPVRRVRYAVAPRETLAYGGTMLQALRSVSGWRALAGLHDAFRREVRRQLQEHPDTVVHAHWWVPAALALPAGVRHVVTCHGTDVRLLRGPLPIRWLGRRVLRRATVITTVSRPLAVIISRVTGRDIPDDQVQPMPIPAVDRPVSSGGGGIVVLGRLSAQKRINLALESYALARQQGVTVPLVIVGDGTERAALEAQVSRLDLGESVRFVGAVAPTAIPEFLSRADLLLMPAENEGFGLAAAEALIQGVPVVACIDGGGLEELVSAEGAGCVVAPRPAAIASAMHDVLNSSGAREAAARAGEVWRTRLSPEYVADRCLDWYQRVLAA